MAYLVILELRHVCLLFKPGVLIFIITFCRNQVTRSAMSRLFSIGIVGSHQDNSYFQIRESNKNVGYLFWMTLIAIISLMTLLQCVFFTGPREFRTPRHFPVFARW